MALVIPTPGQLQRQSDALIPALRPVSHTGDHDSVHVIDSGVGIGFAHVDRMQMFHDYLGDRLDVVDAVVFEWRRRANLRFGEGHAHIDQLVKRASGIALRASEQWRIVELDASAASGIEQIQTQLRDYAARQGDPNAADPFRHYGEAASIFHARTCDGIVLTNDGGARHVAQRQRIRALHSGHVLRELVHAGRLSGAEAWGLYCRIVEVSGVGGADVPEAADWFAR